MGTPLVHVVTLGSDRGLPSRDAAGLLAVMMVSGMAGRIVFGRIADRIGSLHTYIAASLGQTLLAFLFPYAGTPLALYLLAAVFGLIFSGAMTSFLVWRANTRPPARPDLPSAWSCSSHGSAWRSAPGRAAISTTSAVTTTRRSPTPPWRAWRIS